MVQFNIQQREMTLKIVYYGPALSGKTTNLQVIHDLLDAGSRGRLMVLDTAEDRTLFFDLMPVFFKTRSGFTIKVKLFTVPGQVMHDSTRRVVLQGADGIAFIADSQKHLTKANNDSWKNMTRNLGLNKMDIKEMPIVIQFNKRDLVNIRSDEEIDRVAKLGKEPVFKASAIQGKGVLETLEGVLRSTWQSLEQKYSFQSKLDVTENEIIQFIIRQKTTTGDA